MAEPVTTPLPCHACGVVGVVTNEVEVHTNRREDVAVYLFTCPGCREVVVGGCREMVARLLASGARHLELRSTTAPPISHDDVLDLHQWLARDLPWPATP